MAVYVVTHKPAPLPAADWLVPIGVGGFRDGAVQLCDAVGDHVAPLNRSHCELTASYWLWRNRTDPYLGLCHYRRYFSFIPLPGQSGQQPMVRAPAEQPVLDFAAAPAQHERLEQLLSCFEMVAAQPVYLWPSVGDAFGQAHGAGIWAAFEASCRKEFGAAVDTLQAETRFHPFNMVVARREVFGDYCARLFRVLERVVAEVGDRAALPDARFQPYRYPGYLGERFTGIYLTATGVRHTTAPVICLE